MKKTNKLLLVGLAVLAPVCAFADAPIDMAATATEIAGYVATAATAGLAIFAAIFGVKIIIRAFKAAKG